ncbi:zinc finger protein 837 isoform X5 [Manis javanica]|uniref:zinc finger protein 837 isoform X5 n=1 Tax=Manis javanica TaxID=9974 RepID=UPI003C6DB1C2
MGGRNDGRRLHGNGELRERSSFIRSRSLRTHPRRAGLAVAMVTGKPSHAPVRPPEGKRGQGAVSGFLWGSLTGERGPGRRVGPQHHREGRPGRPERPSQGAAEGLAAGLPAPGFIVTNCWDGQCPWTGGTHAACSSGNSRCSPRPFLRSRDPTARTPCWGLAPGWRLGLRAPGRRHPQARAQEADRGQESPQMEPRPVAEAPAKRRLSQKGDLHGGTAGESPGFGGWRETQIVTWASSAESPLLGVWETARREGDL